MRPGASSQRAGPPVFSTGSREHIRGTGRLAVPACSPKGPRRGLVSARGRAGPSNCSRYGPSLERPGVVPGRSRSPSAALSPDTEPHANAPALLRGGVVCSRGPPGTPDKGSFGRIRSAKSVDLLTLSLDDDHVTRDAIAHVKNLTKRHLHGDRRSVNSCSVRGSVPEK